MTNKYESTYNANYNDVGLRMYIKLESGRFFTNGSRIKDLGVIRPPTGSTRHGAFFFSIHNNIIKIHLLENLKTFLSSIQKSKPESVKGSFIKKVTIASTMGVGLEINLASLR